MSHPVCKTCKRTGNGVTFNMFPKTEHTFGEICTDCESIVLIDAATDAELGFDT